MLFSKRATRALHFFVLFLFVTLTGCSCANTSGYYEKTAQTLVEYRNQIVTGAIKSGSESFKEFAEFLSTEQINVQNSGPRDVKIPLSPGSDKARLLVGKTDIVRLFRKAELLSGNLPEEGKTNSYLEDFDAAAKSISNEYGIYIELTPI